MDHGFKAGDVVQLKSGGPDMTIEDIDKYGPGTTTDSAKCVWFEGMKRKDGLFELATLRSADTPATTISRLAGRRSR
jgi:uncharacterized protein YodC (DUF2158 family)